MSRVPLEELERVLEILEADVVDDAEELLMWFGEHGPSLIREVLEGRKE